MRVTNFVAALSPIEYNFLLALGQTESPLQFARTYRFCWTESGSANLEFMDTMRSMLEEANVPPGILAALEDDRLHYLLLNYSLIVMEEVARISK